MKKNQLIRAVKEPKRVPKYFRWRLWLQTYFAKKVEKRVHFDYEEVSSGWGIDGAGLPHYAARLYLEVRLLREALANCKAEKSLEIGCGYGRLTPWIAEFSKEHYAIDPEEKFIRDASLLHPQIHFQKAKAQKLPFPDDFFDLCLTWTVLQHIPPEEIVGAVNEIKRVAKQSAIIIVTEGVGTFQNETTFYRTVESWEELFQPWKLVWQTDRSLEETTWKDQGKVMRFERNASAKNNENRS